MRRLTALLLVALTLAVTAWRPTPGGCAWLPWSYPVLYAWSVQGDPEATRLLLQAGPPYTDWTLGRLLERNPRVARDFSFPVPEQTERWLRLALTRLDPERGRGDQFNGLFLRQMAAWRRPELPELILEWAENPATPRRQALLALSFLGGEDFPEGQLDVPAGPWQERARRCYAQRAGRPPRQPDPLPGLALELDRLDYAPDVRRFAERLTSGQRLRLLDEFSGPDPSRGRVLFWKLCASGPEQPQATHAAAQLWLMHSAPPGVLPRAAEHDLASFGGLDSLLLVRLAEDLPGSRLARGCREYAAIRGGVYFGDLKPGPPAGRVEQWRAWLSRYPDHPGADDSAYWLGRGLEWQGRRVEALAWFLEIALHCPGDRDLEWRIRDHLHWMLDVGLSAADLDSWLVAGHESHPARDLVSYARALRDARRHRYAQALQRTAGLKLEGPLGDSAYWNDPGWSFESPDRRLEELHLDRPSLDRELAFQRQLWQNAPMGGYALGARWAAVDGWRLGYFLPLRGMRTMLWEYTWNGYLRDYQQRADRQVLLEETRWANHNMVAYELMGQLESEKALYMRVALLSYQAQRAPAAESLALGLTPEQWRSAARRATERLLGAYPRSRYGDDALYVLYDLDGDPRWLERLRVEFPDGDRQAP